MRPGAWSRTLPAVCLCLTVTFFALAATMPDEDWPLVVMIAVGLVTVIAAGLGALIGVRRPGNVIGLLLSSVTVLVAAGFLATQYANRALIDAPGSLPGGVIAAWLQSWLWAPFAGALPLFILLYPTGKPPSARWRPVAWLCATLAVGSSVTVAFRPGPFDTFPQTSNPLGTESLPTFRDAVDGVWALLLVATMLLAVAALATRFRRSRGTERLQLKWFVYAVVMAVALFATNPLLFSLFQMEGGLMENLGWSLPLLGLLLIVSAVAMAILRYRLYEIDRLISRTATYVIVIAFLGLVYAGLVAALGTAVRPLSGGTDLAVAASTLIVAAVSRPFSRRVRSRIDRRFNRVRYDAARTIERFTARLREGIDIDSLHADLRQVVTDTMHPTFVTMWTTDGVVTVPERRSTSIR